MVERVKQNKNFQTPSERQVEKEIKENVDLLMQEIQRESEIWLKNFPVENLNRLEELGPGKEPDFKTFFPEEFPLPPQLEKRIQRVTTLIKELPDDARTETVLATYRLMLQQEPAKERIGQFLREEFQDLFRVCDLDDEDYFHRYCVEYARLRELSVEDAQADVQEKLAMYRLPEKFVLLLERFCRNPKCRGHLDGQESLKGGFEEMDEMDWQMAIAKEREALRLPMVNMIKKSLVETRSFLMGFMKDAQNEFSLMAYLAILHELQGETSAKDRVGVIMDQVCTDSNEEVRALVLDFIDELLMILPERLEQQVPENLRPQFLDSLEGDDWDQDLV